MNEPEFKILKPAFVVGVPALAVVNLLWALNHANINPFPFFARHGNQIPDEAIGSQLGWVLWFFAYLVSLVVCAVLAVKGRNKEGRDFVGWLKKFVVINFLIRLSLVFYYAVLAVWMLVQLDSAGIDGTAICIAWLVFAAGLLVMELVYNGSWWLCARKASKQVSTEENL